MHIWIIIEIIKYSCREIFKKKNKTNLQYSQTLDTLYRNHLYKFRLCGDIVSSEDNCHRVVSSSLQTSYYRILKENKIGKKKYRKWLFGVSETFSQTLIPPSPNHKQASYDLMFDSSFLDLANNLIRGK